MKAIKNPNRRYALVHVNKSNGMQTVIVSPDYADIAEAKNTLYFGIRDSIETVLNVPKSPECSQLKKMRKAQYA